MQEHGRVNPIMAKFAERTFDAAPDHAEGMANKDVLQATNWKLET